LASLALIVVFAEEIRKIFARHWSKRSGNSMENHAII
jgi:hypothetical protein